MLNIKIAYLLVVHKNPEQVNLFVEQLLDYGDCDIYIHVDMKKPEIIDRIIKNDRVFICSVYDVQWGSFGLVRAGCYLMRMAHASGKNYTHMYFGSGQDLLVRRGLYEHLAQNPSKTFLHISGEMADSDRGSPLYRVRWPRKLMIRNDFHIYRFTRITIQLLFKLGIVLFPNKNQLNNPVRFYAGRTWFIAPIEVMEYILTYIDENPDYECFFKDSLASDLIFFQTIIMNSPYKKDVEDELMYVNFGKTFGSRNHPLNITIDDDKKINGGGRDYYCARKFEIDDMATINYYLNKVKK